MFWENEYEPTIVGCELSDEELQEFLEEKDIGLQIVDNSTRWCAFAQYYAHQKGFDMIHSTSFAYMVSLFMTGMGISASTEMYIKEETLELYLVDRLNEIKSTDISEEEQIKTMFNTIFEVYSNHISEYEYATERVSFKLTPTQMEKFQSVPGRNNKEKFKKLIGDKMYTVSDNRHSKDLVHLGFPKNLCTSPESCEILLEHCQKYNMKFLKDSYGTLIHNDFDKYFKKSNSLKMRDKLTCKDELIEELSLPLDHTNLLNSKIDKEVYILTSSPYNPSLNMNLFNQIKEYPYSIYAIHPNFLDYMAFVDNRSVGALRRPLNEVNYAFTNASPEQMLKINKRIYDDLNIFGFEFLSSGER